MRAPLSRLFFIALFCASSSPTASATFLCACTYGTATVGACTSHEQSCTTCDDGYFRDGTSCSKCADGYACLWGVCTLGFRAGRQALQSFTLTEDLLITLLFPM